jgi:hypothetical protein
LHDVTTAMVLKPERHDRDLKGPYAMKKNTLLGLTLVAGLGLSACTDPYDPGQRAVGGGLLGAGAGAALGGIAGGGRGAAIGALAGGALGAAGGAATTPSAPRPYYQQQAPAYRRSSYNY